MTILQDQATADRAEIEGPLRPFTKDELALAVAEARLSTLPVTEPTTDPLTLSVSEVRVLRQCPRRYFHEYVRGRQSSRGPGIEAEWGAALHRGLEAWLADDLARDGKPWGALEAALSSGMDDAGRPYAPPADPYARAALRAMLRAYAAVWGPVDAERYEVVSVELPFDLPVLTRTGRPSRNGERGGARREGRLDAVVRERAPRCPTDTDCPARIDAGWEIGDRCPIHGTAAVPGRVWIVEHKSTGKPPGEPRFYAGIELDSQIATYFDAARLQGLDPRGVLFDVVRRPDFDDPKPAPALTKSGKERKAPTEECGACDGRGVIPTDFDEPEVTCGTCKGEKRVTKTVAYSNPRFGESAAAYEERVYQLATSKPADYFGRRELPIEGWQIEEARLSFWSAAREIKAFERAGVWPMVGDRYTCAPRGRVCPWLGVCGRVESGDDDRLFPLKVSRKEGNRG